MIQDWYHARTGIVKGLVELECLQEWYTCRIGMIAVVV